MRRIVFLAYYFPPHGGAGVQRSAAFARQLPELGYEPVVVTGPESPTRAWTPPDPTLAGATANQDVLRVDAPQPPASGGWRGRLERWLRLPTPFERWWIEGAETVASRIVGAELVYASMSPFESGEAAARIARRLGIPWVADLRDPWALDEVLVYPTWLHRRLELRRMHKTLSSASAIVMNTPEATIQLRRRWPDLGAKPVVTIPNGFEESDFLGPAPPRPDDTFRIVHAGYVHTPGPGDRRTQRLRQLLGGSFRGYDLYTRSHVYLLRAVDLVLSRHPDLASKLEVHLVGLLSDRDRSVVRPDVVRARGYLPHDESVDLLRSADLLFLPMHDLPPGCRATIVPGKTYEYLASGTPILAAVPDGDARDLMQRAGNAFVCRPADVEGMARAITGQLERWAAGEPKPSPLPEVVSRYERRRLSAALAATFDSLLAERSGMRASTGLAAVL